jgi:hypothetical protein
MRTMVLVMDLAGPDMILAIAEPLSKGYETHVEIHPAMNLDDLKKAISQMQGNKNLRSTSFARHLK